MKIYVLKMSRFVCTNVKELQAKGLVPLGDLIMDEVKGKVEGKIKGKVEGEGEVGYVIIYDITTDTVTHLKAKVVTDDALWIITEDSFTDNLDNDTFTYFKYKVCKNDI
jgi:hypothetical protein